jgi:hypothetical protein
MAEPGRLAQPQVHAPTALLAKVIDQSPSVFITLISVLVGLVLTDLVTDARARMHLWPLDFMAIRTWGQLIGQGTCAVAFWVILAHLGIVRKRFPDLLETVSAFVPPVILLAAATFVGRPAIWPWFYLAALYLFTGIAVIIVQVRMTMSQPGGAALRRLLRPTGQLSMLYLGAAAFLLGGLLDQHGWLPPSAVLTLALAPTPMSLFVAWLFLYDLREVLSAAVDEGPPPSQELDGCRSLRNEPD